MNEAELLLAAEALSGIGGWTFDATAQVLQCTPQALRLHGRDPSAAQVSLADLLESFEPADRPRLHELLRSVTERRQRAEAAFTVRLPGGESRRLLLQAAPAPGQPQRVLGTVRLLEGAAAAPRPMTMDPQSAGITLAAAGIGVFEIDLASGREAWSARTLEIYGLPADSAAPTRQQWREQFVHPDDLARIDARAAEFVAGGRPYEMDYRIRRRSDGAQRWLHTRAAFAYGGTQYVLGITLDISERKQAEERAQDAWHALQVSAEQVGFGFGVRDLRGEAGEWSPQLKRMFGLQADAPTPDRNHLLAMIHPGDRERMRAQMALQPRVGEVREIEYRVPQHDGSMRVLLTRAAVRVDAEGRPWRFYFVVLDLTETRAKDRRVSELLARVMMATEASGIGTWERDPQAERALWDDATLALFGLPPGAPAPTGAAYLALLHPDDRDRIARELRAARAPGETFEYQFRVGAEAGAVRWLCVRGRVQGDAAGHGQRRIGICFDITERKQAEAAVQARELAERANAAKTEFLSRMSHELRTPLNAVLGFAQLLLLDAARPLSDAQRSRVEHIQNAGWHLLALINDVLDLTRIESRQAQMNPELVPLREVADECLAMNAAAAAQRGIRLQGLPEGAPARVWADRTRLRQVLLNLLSNAVKYNRPHGWVELAAHEEPTGEVSVLVRDGGLGLTPEQLQQLFEPFNRLGRELGGVEGTGIGLALSRLIAEQMGGRLEARSEAGVGSEFRLTLPAAP